MNPWLTAIRATWPYLLAAAIGFAAAWGIQGVRIDAEINKLQRYINEQARLADEAKAKADQQRQETADAWAKNLEQVLNDKGAYERCVAAGRCGAVVRVLPGASCPQAGGVQTAPGTHDDEGRGAVPASAGTPAEVVGLIEDCKTTQIKLNTLRDDIRKQPSWAP